MSDRRAPHFLLSEVGHGPLWTRLFLPRPWESGTIWNLCRWTSTGRHSSRALVQCRAINKSELHHPLGVSWHYPSVISYPWCYNLIWGPEMAGHPFGLLFPY